jgi:hypothetical protein
MVGKYDLSIYFFLSSQWNRRYFARVWFNHCRQNREQSIVSSVYYTVTISPVSPTMHYGWTVSRKIVVELSMCLARVLCPLYEQ